MASIAARTDAPGRLIWGFGAILAITVAGFWPSFFSDPLSNDTAHIIHGTAATGWLLLLMLQSWLIATRRHRLHKTLGRWSPLLVAVLIGAAVQMVHTMLTGPMPANIALMLAASDICGLMLFVALYGAALYFRRTRALHSRLMGTTVLVGVPPAIGRLLPAGPGWAGSFYGRVSLSYIFIEIVLLALIANDARRAQLRWPFPAALAAFALTHAWFGIAPASPAFRSMAGVFGFPG
jgi:hypothetical protein